MKKTLSLLLFIIYVIALTGCSGNFSADSSTSEAPVSISAFPSVSSEQDVQGDIPPVELDMHTKEELSTVNIQVGNKNFTATLYDNDSTQVLLERLPLTLNMDELNGNEKFCFFSEKFPTDSEAVGNIKAGDLMLYGSDCLVLFYESFSTLYNYTRLGYIEDAEGLTDALGSGSIEVTFSIGG